MTVTEPVYADVVDVVPVTQTKDVPHEVCNNQQVQVRQPERFGDKDGMVAGALIGGLLGNQVGGGNGKKAATVAGVVGGGYAGRQIDRRHAGRPGDHRRASASAIPRPGRSQPRSAMTSSTSSMARC